MSNCLFCDQSAGHCVFCGDLCDVCGTPLDPGAPPTCPRCVAVISDERQPGLTGGNMGH
jgi:hypothetical protein